MSCLLSSSTPVVGEVLWVSSHCSMALRSYVWPSACFATREGGAMSVAQGAGGVGRPVCGEGRGP